MKRCLAITFLMVLLIGMAGCARKLIVTTITGKVLEHGLPVDTNFPGGVISLYALGNPVGTFVLQRGDSGWKIPCKPGQYELAFVSDGRLQRQTIDTSNGSKEVAVNFEDVVIYGCVQLDGVSLDKLSRMAAQSVGIVKLELLKDGTTIDQRELAGVSEYKFVVPSGMYIIRATFGTQIIELPVNGTLSTQRIVDLARTATIRGTIEELGLVPGPEWPGGTVRVENLNGVSIEEIPVVVGQDTYEIRVKAGMYKVVARSAGREITSGTVDLSEKSEAFFAIKFDQVVLYGPLRAETTRIPAATLTISKSGAIACKISLEGDNSYRATLLPGKYDLEIEVPSTGGHIHESVDLSSGSRCLELDLHQKASISGQITENGLKPDPEAFPLGEVVLRTPDGVVRDTIPLEEDGTFAAQVYASIYSVEATSAGRTKSLIVDTTSSSRAVELDYTDLVLTGTFKLNGQPLPSSFPTADVVLTGPIIRSAGAVSGGNAVFRVVIPSGVYTAKVALRNSSVQSLTPIDDILQRSTLRDIDIGLDIAHINGQITTPIGSPTCAVTGKLYTPGTTNLRASFACDSNCRFDAFVNPGSYDIVIEGSKYDSRKYAGVYISGELSKDLAFETVSVTLGFNISTGIGGGDTVLYSATYEEYDDAWLSPLDDNLTVYRNAFRVPILSSLSMRQIVHAKIGEPLYIFISHGISGLCFHRKTVTPTENGLAVVLNI